VRVSDKVMQYARTQKPAMKVYTKTVPWANGRVVILFM
jgi:hypothetical protein